ncbi:hypothetical protein [Nocardia sp. alder85J]|uniref:hypothetical protein n=1 Tax=Nocardia sp. alder85J TaxID=2862949 RepID=UPI001CD1A1EE|nr:hypothetical protein [Nocardia sp. alder85J]MCX4095383.1 hypothetical protein [Nocardia sp. alder85J]
MTGWEVSGAALVLIGALGTVAMSRRPHHISTGRSVAEIRQRLLAEITAPELAPPVLLIPHSAPACAPDIPEAHRTMQEHLECAVADCPRKAAAYRVLVAAGRITPR